ncbi:MAG TPA: energy transducer TonB [Pyrinomonadaceae bacterium]|nr:energy transducer TonB [Pyrinomonadaceae bacterium]
MKRENLRIISKPRANYTDVARTNYVQGKVVLRVTFLADGQIGGISTISGLPDGLTEQAIKAAREIKFEPPMKDGKKITVTKPVEYTFTIY